MSHFSKVEVSPWRSSPGPDAKRAVMAAVNINSHITEGQ
jgi:hypothetical protein